MTEVGHSLVGITIGIAGLPNKISNRWKLTIIISLAILSNLPDFPFPFWGHEKYHISHSVFVNSIIAIILSVWLSKNKKLRSQIGVRMIFLSVFLALIGHLLLDSFYNHGKGVAIYWPFSSATLALPIPWLSVVPALPPITIDHLREYVFEFITFFPFVIMAIFFYRRRYRENALVNEEKRLSKLV
jgi:membrane-bound metal-dependent hydrolase YbcI (DUF457 family)